MPKQNQARLCLTNRLAHNPIRGNLLTSTREGRRTACGRHIEFASSHCAKGKNKPDEDIVDMIEGSIDFDERALPGLGVLFEMIWKASSSEARQQLIDTLQSKLQDEQVGK